MTRQNIFQRIYSFLWQNHTLGQTALKNTFWLSISQIVSRLIRAIVVIYSIRVLGAHGYGVFSYALAIAGLSAIILEAGINRLLVKEISHSPENRAQLITTGFVIKIALLTTLFILMSVVYPNFISVKEAGLILPVIGVLFFSDGIREFGYAIIRSTERMEIETILNLITNITTVILAWIVLNIHPTPHALAAAYMVASICGTLITLIVIRKDIANLANFQPSLVKPLLTLAWPLALTNLLWSVLNYTDTLMIGWLSSAREVGFYSAAQRPIQVLLIIPTLLATSILPIISRLAQQDRDKFNQLIAQTISIVLLVALPLTTCGALLSDQIIIKLYGQGYAQTIPVFIVFTISFLINFPVTVLNSVILALNLQKSFLPYVAIGAILNVILNILFITQYGATGAAFATVLSQIVAGSLIIFILHKRIRLNVWPMMTKIIVATIVTTGLVWLSKTSGLTLYWSLSIAVFTYIISLVLLKETLLKKLVSIIKHTV